MLYKNIGFRLFTYGAEKLSSVGSLRANLPQEESALLAIVQKPTYEISGGKAFS